MWFSLMQVPDKRSGSVFVCQATPRGSWVSKRNHYPQPESEQHSQHVSGWRLEERNESSSGRRIYYADSMGRRELQVRLAGKAIRRNSSCVGPVSHEKIFIDH